MLKLFLNELKLIAKSRGIKGYKIIFEERLLSAVRKSILVQNKNSFVDKRLKHVRKDFDDKKLKKIRKYFHELKDRFSKPQIKKIIKNLYEIEKKRIFLNQK